VANNPVVHVIDDDEAVRDSLAFLLDCEGMAVRTYESALAFLDDTTRREAGCIVTDVRMPGMTGLDLVRRLAALGVKDPVIVITGHADVPLAVQAMKAGVSDFIEKPFDNELLLGAIGRALSESRDRQERDEESRAVAARIDALSGRERQVLDALVEGKPNKIIAFDLGISARTVEIYRANVMSKMGAGSLSELVRMALLAGRAL
jgi:two-component system response regulator FixJ